MSRLNKALERIRSRETIGQNTQGKQAQNVTRSNVVSPFEDPITADTRKIRLNSGMMEANHLITDHVDPAVRTSYKMLRTRVLQVMRSNGWNSIAVTSATQGDGKTVTAINLAISLAGDVNHNVCLVDLDLRHSSVARYLDLKIKHGVSDVLTQKVSLENALVKPNIERLAILPNVHNVAHSSEMLSSPSMQAVADKLSCDPNRIIIYDMPPILAADDMLAFGEKVDGILFVVSEGRTSRTDTVRARELMDQFNIIGTVLNRSDEKTATYY